MAEGASLTVMGGPLAGTRLDIDDAVDEVLVGSDPDCRLSLDLPGVSPIHARIWRDLGGVTVYDTRSARGVYVNDERVVEQAALHDGDVLWLGPPRDPDSVMLECHLPNESLLDAPLGDLGPPPDAPPEPVTADRDLLDDLLDVAPAPREDAIDGPATVAFVPSLTPAPEPEPQFVEPAPPEPLEDDLVTDPAWMEEEPAAATALPPVDLDSLVDEPSASASAPAVEEEPFELAAAWEMPATKVGGDAPPAEEPPSAPAEAAEAEADTTFFVDEPAPPAPPAPAPPATPTPRTPVAATPVAATPVAAAPRAVIDDTRPRTSETGDAARKPRAGRAGEVEGVMDWARASGASTAESLPPVGRERVAARRSAPRSRMLLPVGLVLAVLAAAGGYFAWTASRAPVVATVSPPRVRVGDTLTLGGSHLGESAGDATVTIGGRPAKVIRAGGTTLQVQVPEVPMTPGRDTSAPVVVTAGGRASQPATVALFQAPRLAALSPDVGMPGDEIAITGDSLGQGVKVRFGNAEAQVVAADGRTVRVKVPPLTAAAGTEVPVVATMGADPSNAIEFVVGTLPLVTGTDLRAGTPGDLVTVAGRGFAPQPAANRVTIAGVRALVVSSSPREIKAVVPRAPEGESTLDVSIAASATPGRIPFAVTAPPEPIGFLFVAEPFADAPGHDHAVLATGLGPAFVLSAAGGRTAAARAHDAQVKLNEAGKVLATSREADVRARLEGTPALQLYGRNSVVFEVTDADAAAYDEDWTRARVKGAPVTPARLLTWWDAVARDLVLLLVRGDKPVHAVALAAEGKALVDAHDAARRSVAVGVPAALVAQRAALREGLRVVGLRVPASVTAAAPVATRDGEAPAPAADAVAPLRLDGTWNGTETEGGLTKTITITFRGASGTLTYQRALTLSVPVVGVGQQRGAVRFELPTGGGRKHYRGRWDGAKITGSIASDAAGGRSVGTFELEPAE